LAPARRSASLASAASLARAAVISGGTADRRLRQLPRGCEPPRCTAAAPALRPHQRRSARSGADCDRSRHLPHRDAAPYRAVHRPHTSPTHPRQDRLPPPGGADAIAPHWTGADSSRPWELIAASIERAALQHAGDRDSPVALDTEPQDLSATFNACIATRSL